MRGREHTCTTTYIHIHWRHEKLVKTQHFYYIIVDNNYVRDIEWAARDRHRRFDWSRNFRFRRQHLNSSNHPGDILVLVLNRSNTKTIFSEPVVSYLVCRWTFFFFSNLNTCKYEFDIFFQVYFVFAKCTETSIFQIPGIDLYIVDRQWYHSQRLQGLARGLYSFSAFHMERPPKLLQLLEV